MCELGQISELKSRNAAACRTVDSEVYVWELSKPIKQTKKVANWDWSGNTHQWEPVERTNPPPSRTLPGG